MVLVGIFSIVGIIILLAGVYSQKVEFEDNQTQQFQQVSSNKYQILHRYNRKDKYFTQGLSFFNDEGVLLESTGMYGESQIHFIQYKNSKILKEVKLDKKYFGEGSDYIEVNNEIFYMTWTQRVVFVYNKNLEFQRSIRLPSDIQQGWGMTHFTNKNGEVIILVTDGTNNIYHVRASDFKVIKIVPVYLGTTPINDLNEIEIYNGKLLANIFLQSKVYVIDYDTGKIENSVDFQGLIDDMELIEGYKGYTKKNYGNYCLNGIAYNEKNNILLVTGKMWPVIYEIEMKI